MMRNRCKKMLLVDLQVTIQARTNQLIFYSIKGNPFLMRIMRKLLI